MKKRNTALDGRGWLFSNEPSHSQTSSIWEVWRQWHFCWEAWDPMFYLALWLWRSAWKEVCKNLCPEQPMKCKQWENSAVCTNVLCPVLVGDFLKFLLPFLFISSFRACQFMYPAVCPLSPLPYFLCNISWRTFSRKTVKPWRTSGVLLLCLHCLCVLSVMKLNKMLQG